MYEYESDFIWIVPEYHREILKQSISSNRFFVEGHKKSVSIIKKCFDNIATILRYGVIEDVEQIPFTLLIFYSQFTQFVLRIL